MVLIRQHKCRLYKKTHTGLNLVYGQRLTVTHTTVGLSGGRPCLMSSAVADDVESQHHVFPVAALLVWLHHASASVVSQCAPALVHVCACVCVHEEECILWFF